MPKIAIIIQKWQKIQRRPQQQSVPQCEQIARTKSKTWEYLGKEYCGCFLVPYPNHNSTQKSGNHDDGASGGDSTVTKGATPPTVEPKNPSEKSVYSSDVPESGGKRVPTKRVLTGRDPHD